MKNAVIPMLIQINGKRKIAVKAMQKPNQMKFHLFFHKNVGEKEIKKDAVRTRQSSDSQLTVRNIYIIAQKSNKKTKI